jgi:hypothetical protein
MELPPESGISELATYMAFEIDLHMWVAADYTHFLFLKDFSYSATSAISFPPPSHYFSRSVKNNCFPNTNYFYKSE